MKSSDCVFEIDVQAHWGVLPQVVTAINGEDAMEALDEDTWPDIVFLDYHMGLGESGDEVSVLHVFAPDTIRSVGSWPQHVVFRVWRYSSKYLFVFGVEP